METVGELGDEPLSRVGEGVGGGGGWGGRDRYCGFRPYL